MRRLATLAFALVLMVGASHAAYTVGVMILMDNPLPPSCSAASALIWRPEGWYECNAAWVWSRVVSTPVTTINIKGSTGGNCTLTVTYGLITASTCP